MEVPLSEGLLLYLVYFGAHPLTPLALAGYHQVLRQGMFAGHSKRPVAWTNQGRYSYSFLPGEQCYICSMKSLFSIGKTGFLHGLQVLDNTELSKWITSSDGPLYSGKFIYY